MLVSEFDFFLPQNLIAQKPFFPKEQTKMLVYDGTKIQDQNIINLLDFLQEGDVLVFNNAKVINAKLNAKILRSNSNLSFNLDQEIEPKIWQVLVRGSKKIKDGDLIEIAPHFQVKIIKKNDDGSAIIEFFDDDYLQKLERYGSIPLPPYIKRENKDLADQTNYQTIYAAEGKAVAAPTAGLHFTENMFKLLDQKKVNKVFITLNVGAGTFLPVRSEKITEHKMHQESFCLSVNAANIINQAKKGKKRIIAIGSTSLRVLESCANADGSVKPTNGKTNIFIYPPYKFKVVDILMTNFHLPKSTLFMMICAFVGKEKAVEIYNHAIKNNYRFYSYGDSSLLFRKM